MKVVFKLLLLHPSSSIMSHISHHVKHGIVLCVVNEGEHVVVNQVVEEVDPSVEVGFDIDGTTPEPDFSVNEGKLWMHLNLPCVLQNYFAFAFIYFIK